MWSDKQIVLIGVQEQCARAGMDLREKGWNIRCVVTVECSDNISGWYDLKGHYEALGIPVYVAKSYSLKEDLEFFVDQKFELGILLGWQRLIPEEVIREFRLGIIGQHGSSEKLPRGRGRSPINWSILEGKKSLIWHLFWIKPGIDDGDILDLYHFDITEHDTCRSIYQKLEFVLPIMLHRTLNAIQSGKLIGEEQVGEPSFYKKRTPEDGEIDWNASCEDIHNLVRAVTKPYPGALATLGGVRYKVWASCIWSRSLLSEFDNQRTGQIVLEVGDGLVVKCRDGLILLKTVDLEESA